MARVVVLGAGISGHNAAMLMRKKLGRAHDVTVVSPNSLWNWIPSNIWVGVGRMTPEQVTFSLAEVYKRHGINYLQAKATELYPEGSGSSEQSFVTVEHTSNKRKGEREEIPFDYLVNATGPKLNFAATPGLGPDGHSLSVCTFDHAAHTAKVLAEKVEKMRLGHEQTFVIGTGHGLCTCEGAAFEYILNLEFELNRLGVRDKARIICLTNEAEIGDFGVGGLHWRTGGYIMHSKLFAESLMGERRIEWITGTHVEKVEPNKVTYETLDGSTHELAFDFAMLLPPFRGADIKAFDKSGTDISTALFAPNGFMKVDGDYSGKPFEDWAGSDWPKTYQVPKYPRIFAIGIAFAPPHPISMPRKSAKGTPITPSPPRTGMPSAIMGRAAAMNIVRMIKNGGETACHTASLSDLGAACVASAGASWLRGSAAAMTMYPIVPDFKRFPPYGRDLRYTFGEIGSAGHWIKYILHYMFLYKAKGHPFWWLLPE